VKPTLQRMRLAKVQGRILGLRRALGTLLQIQLGPKTAGAGAVVAVTFIVRSVIRAYAATIITSTPQ
jgi:hypothetical protein